MAAMNTHINLDLTCMRAALLSMTCESNTFFFSFGSKLEIQHVMVLVCQIANIKTRFELYRFPTFFIISRTCTPRVLINYVS